nr:hypothetical protein [Treponema sp.]
MFGNSFIKKVSLFIFLASFFSFSLFPQQRKNSRTQSFLNDFVRKNWTTEDGLPGMTITTLMQDKKGFIWIGTYDGLVRFDGLDFKIYNRAFDEKYDFASARSIFQDSKDNIWVGHNDEGVSRLGPDGSVQKFTTKDGIPNNKVNAVCEDKDGNIWIGTAAGVCFLTPDGRVQIPRASSEIDPEKLLVVDLYKDNGDRLWLTTGMKDALLFWNGQSLEVYDGLKKIDHPAIRVVHEDKEGNLCFCVEPFYIVKIRKEEEELIDLSDAGRKGTIVTSMLNDSKGNYWLGTDVGVFIVRDNDILHYGREEGLPDEGVTRIIEDNEGNIWIGFNRGGLQKLTKSKFRTVSTDASVNVICEDKIRGVTWIGADDGLHAYANNLFVENEITDLCKNIRVRHVGLTDEGELLISTYSKKAQIRVTREGDIKIWGVEDGLSTGKCRVSIKTKNGDYYVGTPIGLNIIHHEDGKITTLTHDDGFTNHY